MFFHLLSLFTRKPDASLTTPSDATTQIRQPEQKQTVKNLLEKPLYGTIVRLTGKIEAFLGGNRYLFSDGTGHMAIRVSLQVFGETALFKTSQIVILGDLKRTFSGSHILRTQHLQVLYY